MNTLNIEPIAIVGGLFAIAVIAIVVVSMRKDAAGYEPKPVEKKEDTANVRVIPKTAPKKKAPVKKAATATTAKKAVAKKAPAKKAAPKKK